MTYSASDLALPLVLPRISCAKNFQEQAISSQVTGNARVASQLQTDCRVFSREHECMILQQTATSTCPNLRWECSRRLRQVGRLLAGMYPVETAVIPKLRPHDGHHANHRERSDSSADGRDRRAERSVAAAI